MRVCIDPGHGLSNRVSGRYDPGAVANTTEEAALVLNYGLALRDELNSRGHDVIMTRAAENQTAPLGVRAKFSADCDVFLSLHCDSFNNANAHGVHCIYAADEPSSSLAATVTHYISNRLGILDRVNKSEAESGKKAVLNRDTKKGAVNQALAAILIECGFLSNAGDYAKLTNEDAPLLIASAIADALDIWATEHG